MTYFKYLFFIVLFFTNLTYSDDNNQLLINKPAKIGFFCNHGKHRSVGWAEIIKKHYYHNANIRHLTLDY